jgi:hypothetical protein
MTAMEKKKKCKDGLSLVARVHPGWEPTFVLLDFVLLDALAFAPEYSFLRFVALEYSKFVDRS